jgi:leader peptidase (prepilin peptidase)/N-methyltransferase
MVTPALFLFLIQRYGFSIQMGIISAYSVILLLVTVTDLEHKLIFNVVMLPAIIFALIMAFFTDITGFWSFATTCNSLLYAIFVFVFSRPTEFWFIAIIGGATGFIISYTAFLAGNLMYGHGALGSGDVTLSVFLGLILGFPYILSTFIMTVFLGAFIPIILLATRRISRKSYIPYGPFLTSSGWFMLIWGNGIWQYFYC